MKTVLLLSVSFLPTSLFAQHDKLGFIEVYGARKTPVAQILNAIGMKEGDTLDRKTFNITAIEKRILAVPGIAQANVSLICCDEKQGRSILYAGVSEETLKEFPYHDKSAGPYKLDSSILQTYHRYEQVWQEAVRAGKGEEDDEHGHVMLTYPPAFPLQDSFISYAASHLPLLRQVIRESGIAEQRQAATWLIAYTAEKKLVVDDLLYAATDPDETVRNNATRALGLIARYGSAHPSAGIGVPYRPFLKMIRSVIWTDRNKGALVLAALTSGRDSVILQQLRLEALPELEEMARWRNPGHAFFAVFLLGMIANVSDQELFFTTSDRNKQAVIDEWMRKIAKQ